MLSMETLLRFMMEKDASDLFITAGFAPALKIHGRVMPVTNDVLSATQARNFIYSLMSESQRAAFEKEHECNFAISPAGIGRFRVNVFQQQYQTGMVVRKIETRIPTTEELQLPPLLNELAMEKRGLVLLVGATGSGKSTTLAAMVGHRNRNSSGHIVSVEDPIEYVHRPAGCIITQREIGTDTDSYEVALKNVLRQAPDVILVGEIRSREAMNHALTFAETGHLCMSTLHANNANQALERVINFFPKEQRPQLLMDLSLNLRAIIAQRLIPTHDGKARRAAVEILINTPYVADQIMRGEVHLLKDAMKNGSHQGMQTFDQAVYQLYKGKSISYKHTLQYADSPNEVRLMVKLGEKANIDQLASSLSDVELLGPEIQ